MAWTRRAAHPAYRAPGAVATDTPHALRTLVGYSVTFVNENAGRLPAAAVVNARHLTDTMSRIIDVADTQHLNVHDLIVLSSTLTDYLPSTLQAYLKVDPSLREVARPSGTTPVQSLLSQLASLQASADATLDAVHRQDADALLTQGAFLRTKFDRSDLDL